MVAGCGQQLGALLYHAMPEVKSKAEYKLNPTRLAILIDDPYGSLPRSDLRGQLHTTLAAELTAHKVQATIVPMGEMARVESGNRDYDTMSIRAVGEKVQADQVLYISIVTFGVGEEAKHGVYRGEAKALVKICSTERKAAVRLWPSTGDGYVVQIAQPAEQVEEWGNKKAAEAYANTIADRLGKRIAMLFYEHSAEGEGDLAAGRVEAPAR